MAPNTSIAGGTAPFFRPQIFCFETRCATATAVGGCGPAAKPCIYWSTSTRTAVRWRYLTNQESMIGAAMCILQQYMARVEAAEAGW